MPADITTPDWVKHAVFYQIFPDRFAQSTAVSKPNNLEPWDAPPTAHGFKGGDLRGVVEKLDYLQDLGITAIYLNPIFQSASNHRYHTHDYFKVDPLLGGDRAFHRLVREAHRRGIRILLDGVFNHASRGFFQFNHLLEAGEQSPYRDWFHVHGFPVRAYDAQPNYAAWWNLPALPKLNMDNPQVRAFIMDVARYWVEQGADGWRLDVPEEIDDDGFWQEFRAVVKRANPGAYIVGEIWHDAHRWLQGDQFDAVMNYPLAYACLSFFGGRRVNPEQAHANARPHLSDLDAPGFAARVDDLLRKYTRPVTLAQLNLLDSHDTPRFVTTVGGDRDTLRLATLFQMTYPGAPCIYYGDEIGMEGSFDPDCRRAFPWDETQWDTDLRDYVKDAIALRHAHPALRTGEFIPLHAEGRVYGFLRRLNQDVLVVVFNGGDEARQMNLSVHDHLPHEMVLNTVFGPGNVCAPVGQMTELHVPARTGIVLATE